MNKNQGNIKIVSNIQGVSQLIRQILITYILSYIRSRLHKKCIKNEINNNIYNTFFATKSIRNGLLWFSFVLHRFLLHLSFNFILCLTPYPTFFNNKKYSWIILFFISLNFYYIIFFLYNRLLICLTLYM